MSNPQNRTSGTNWDQYHQSTPKLLPPTVFERTTSATNLNEDVTATNSLNMTIHPNADGSSSSLDYRSLENANEKQLLLKLSGEVEKLRFEVKKFESENEALRHKNKEFVEQAQLYSEASEHRKISINALEEVCQKQTREIQSLKSDLINERESNAVKLASSEKKFTDRLNELTESLNSAESRLKQTLDDQERIKVEFERFRAEKETELVELKNRLEQARIEKEKVIEESELKLKSTNEENRKLASELAQLRSYVNDSMPTVQTVKEMSEERQKCESEIVRLKVRNEQLIGENNALQIRLKSINEILSIQENQLEVKQQSFINEKKYSGLLNKWRTKVFELLVQLKSQELSKKQDSHEIEKRRKEYSDRLETETSRVRILENMLEDKKAEISVLTVEKSALGERLSELGEQKAQLEKRRDEDVQSSLELKNTVEKLVGAYGKIEESFKAANKRLGQLDQRVEYAKNRLGVVKALYAAKATRDTEKRPPPQQPPATQSLLPTLNLTSIVSSIHGSANLNELAQISSLDICNERIRDEHDEDKFLLLKNEFDKVMSERDLLTTRLQKDTQELQTKLSEARQEQELTANTMSAQIKQLREETEKKESELAQAQAELAEKRRLEEELNKEFEKLKKDLAESRRSVDLEAEKKVREREAEFAEKLAAMDEKLNEARREQAKAVVMVRQVERSAAREKERLEGLLKTCDAYYKDHLNRLKERVILLEKERNTLSVSLKQFGPYSTSTLYGTSEQTSRNYMSSKSPLGFFDHDLEAKTWLEKSLGATSSLGQQQQSERETKKKPPASASSAASISLQMNNIKANELTSFWQEDENAQTDDLAQEQQQENNEEEVGLSGFSLGGNTNTANSDMLHATVIQQIRNMMGNLDMSDDEEEPNRNQLSTHREEIGEELDEDGSREQTSAYEVEHVIDEFMSHKKNDSLEN